MAKKRPRVAVVLSDLHCGSTQALMPRDFETLEGQNIVPSASQLILLDWWEDFWKFANGITARDPWVCVLNGDLIEGNHHRTTQIVSPEVGDHCEMAKQLLQPRTNGAAGVFVTLGTECHTARMEHHIADFLRATPDPNTGRPAWERLSLRIGGTLCRFTHHTSTSTRPWLRMNKLGAHLRSAQLEAIDANREPPRVTVAGHCHTFDMMETTNGMSLTTPSWQLQTRYTHKVAPNAVCHIGGVVLDWRDRPDGSMPLVHSFTRAYNNDLSVEV